MKYVKVSYECEYKDKRDNVNRPLVRAFKKIETHDFLEGNKAILLGYVKNDRIYELFTNYHLEVNSYEIIDSEEAKIIFNSVDATEMCQIYNIIRKVIFNEDITLDFEISSMEELAFDRAKQFDAYEKGLTNFNPYDVGYVKSLVNKPHYRD